MDPERQAAQQVLQAQREQQEQPVNRREPGNRQWIDELPAALVGQRALLDGLMALCRENAEIKWFVIGCSLARGAADAMSDLDIAIGLGPASVPAESGVGEGEGVGGGDDAEWQFSASLATVREGVEGLGELVDCFAHQLPGVTGEHTRIFAQYADRCQIDLVLVPAKAWEKFPATTVVLYDPEGWITTSQPPRLEAADQLREWAFHAWCALANLGKYLRRGSVWESLEQLHEARTQAWRLAAAADGVPDPQYGLTSYLDFAPDRIPADLATTVADLDAARLLEAARRLGRLIERVGRSLPDEARERQPWPMAEFIARDLETLVLP
jgi:hypothetical protein